MSRMMSYANIFAITLSILPGVSLQAASHKSSSPDHTLVEIKDDPLQIGCGVELLKLSYPPTDLDLFCTQVMPGIQRQVQHAWRKLAPREADFLQDEKIVTVFFRIHSDGSLAGTSITHHSGIKALDQASVQAIVSAAPYPTFPAQMKSKEMDVSYTFTYDGPVNGEWLPIDSVIWEGQSDTSSPGNQSQAAIGLLLLANNLTVSEWKDLNREYLAPLRHAVKAEWATMSGESQLSADTRKSISEAELTLRSNGTLGSVRWITLTGDHAIDSAADKSLREAFPYKPFPNWCTQPALTMKVYFLYRTEPADVW